MNERIRALAKEAGLWRQHYDIGEESPERLEKFAELIVRECMNTLEFHGFAEAIPYINWMATNKLGQRFGVEQ